MTTEPEAKRVSHTHQEPKCQNGEPPPSSESSVIDNFWRATRQLNRVAKPLPVQRCRPRANHQRQIWEALAPDDDVSGCPTPWTSSSRLPVTARSGPQPQVPGPSPSTVPTEDLATLRPAFSLRANCQLQRRLHHRLQRRLHHRSQLYKLKTTIQDLIT